MKVVHVITGLHSGGAERTLVDHLSETRHQAKVITLATEGRLADELRANGTTVECLHLSSNRDLRGLFRLIRTLRRLRPDVVHLHLYRALVFGRVAARVLRLPVIATEHSAQPTTMERRHASWLVKTIYRLTERLGGRTVAVSEETRNVLITQWGIPPEHITVIPNGVRVDRFVPTHSERVRIREELGLQPDQPVAITVSRLSPEKRVDLAIRLLSQEHMSSWGLIVTGAGPHLDELRALSRELQVESRVHFVGDQARIPAFLAAADVFLQLSDYETYGLSAVEALCSGLPVVYRTAPALDSLRPDPWVICAGVAVDALSEAVPAAFQRGRRALPLPSSLAQDVDVALVAQRLDDAEEEAARASRPQLRRARFTTRA